MENPAADSAAAPHQFRDVHVGFTAEAGEHSTTPVLLEMGTWCSKDGRRGVEFVTNFDGQRGHEVRHVDSGVFVVGGGLVSAKFSTHTKHVLDKVLVHWNSSFG